MSGDPVTTETMNTQLETLDPPTGGSGAMFDGIAGRYDLLNRLTSFGLDQRWRRKLVDSLAPAEPQRILDLATGTADVALAIAARYPEASVVGLDPSANMLALGGDKVTAARLGERGELVQGDAQALPYEDDSFDAATISFGIRNVPDRDQGLREMARVVRPGGVVSILELSEPRGLMAPFARFHVHTVVPTLGALLSGSREYRYLSKSIAAFPPAEEFAAQIERAGLSQVEARGMTFGAVHLYTARVPHPQATEAQEQSA